MRARAIDRPHVKFGLDIQEDSPANDDSGDGIPELLDYKSLGPRTFEDERAEGNVRSRVVAGGCGTVAVGNRRDRPRFPCLPVESPICILELR